MYINLRHRPLRDEDRTHIQLHNTIHITLYIKRLFAYSYEPGLIRSTIFNLPTYQQSVASSMSKSTVTSDLVLDGPSNWDLWIFVVKRIAEAGDVWEYIDPDQLYRPLSRSTYSLLGPIVLGPM